MKHEIICVGSASLDVFVSSKSKDLEFEKIHKHVDVCMPIGSKILLNAIHTEVGGGGVNTAVSFSRLGFKTALISKMGKDRNAETIKKELQKEKITFMGTTEKGQTGYSIIITGLQKDRTILTYKGNNDKLKPKEVPWKKLQTKWFYLATMLGQSHKTQDKIAQYAKKNKIKVLFNPSLYLAEKGMKYLKPILDACNILILNKEEAQAVTGLMAEMPTLLKKLQQKVPMVVITDGPRGAHSYDGKKTYSMTPKKVKVTDPTGAGDSFASAFLSATILGKDTKTALKWGAAQAISVIQHYGATNKLLTRKELAKKAKNACKVSEVRQC
ncbi:carbohydrate kinase family protein [Candidatus Woesearchaeota archaeon]|nr:carbohydrate kinase family protein [Candidatus Woesearchaeota archaeon]MBW3016306.1 carbohydrate kinase family protein [Candidatus Woesearchaeota archaeon]